jgi:PAS domain S-box-containing protein
MPLTASVPPSESGEPADSPPAPPLDEILRQQLLASLLASAPGLVVIYHPGSLRVAYMNDTALARLNPRGSADVARLRVSDFIGLSSQTRLQAEILPQTRVLGRWAGRCDLRDVWGGEFPVRLALRVQKPDAGQREGFLCMYAEERPIDEETDGIRFTDRELLRALLTNTPDSVYFKDTFSRFLRISRAQAEKFGLSDPSQAIGKTDFNFFTVEHASQAYADEQRILETGEPIIDHEEKETWTDGRITWATTTKLPLYNASGKLMGITGVSRDITARKQAEAAQREMEVQLQLAQKMESIGRLAAGVAHEINTPTQFIADNTHFLTEAFERVRTVLEQYRALRDQASGQPGYAPALAAVAAAEEHAEIDYLLGEVPRCLQQSLDGLARVARIVCSLKEFAHPNSPECVPADLNHAIETSVLVSRHEWKYVAEVATELDPALPPVPCVVDEFNQVVLNLIINAAHAIGDALKTRRGGVLGRITIRTKLAAPWALVEVEDTGTGIDPAIIGRIFEPFFTTKAVGKGTGQGLAIVRTVIVSHHHGQVDVESEPGRGAKFIIRLPLARAPAGETKS